MAEPNELRYRLLRAVLLFCGMTWVAAVLGVFLPWEMAARILQGFGAKSLAHDPMLDYWFRMAAGAFGCLGVGYLLLAVNPRKHCTMLPWAGWLMVVEGCVLAVHGVRLGLPAFPFYADVAACLAGGFSILMLRATVSTS